MDKYLKAEMSARGWNVSKLAEACNVSIGLAANSSEQVGNPDLECAREFSQGGWARELAAGPPPAARLRG